MDHRAIGMFDSGIGGMTVFKELTSSLPNEDIIYIGDTASFPYGGKSKETIIELSKKQIQNLINKDVKMIVIACGTATSQALKEMRKIFQVPIIGIIEPTAIYLQKQNLKNIGIIATTGTIRSKGWEEEIQNKIENSYIQSRACPLLAPMAEEGWIDNKIAKLVIHEYVKDFKDIDALVLGCTHYPLFQELIKKELSEKVEIINTGKMVSNEVKKYLKENKLENEKEHKPNYKIYLTDTECNFIGVAGRLVQDKTIIKDIEKI